MGNVLRALVLAVMPALLVAACQSQSYHYQLNTGNQCQSATGEPTVCTVIITNSASSTGDFSWEATSDPNVASIAPSSGAVPPGSSSSKITVTVPSGSSCPVTVTFADSSTNTSTSVQVTSVDGISC
jgi:hypothetical protein